VVVNAAMVVVVDVVVVVVVVVVVDVVVDFNIFIQMLPFGFKRNDMRTTPLHRNGTSIGMRNLYMECSKMIFGVFWLIYLLLL
jgi:hypothetical protein